MKIRPTTIAICLTYELQWLEDFAKLYNIINFLIDTV